MTPAQVETRYKALAHELRCLVCQNQTLADSNADLAQDLRAEVEAQIRQGKSDQQIKDYLVARYGDFVLYRPPVKSQTYLLWGGPFALLATGAGAWWLMRRRQALAKSGSANSPSALEQAKKLLDS